jgi:hypothetical protein
MGVHTSGHPAYVRLGMPADAWRQWNEKHGPAFRALHGIASERDLQRLEAESVPADVPVPGPAGAVGGAAAGAGATRYY